MQAPTCKCKQTLGHLVDEYLSESNLMTWKETRAAEQKPAYKHKIKSHISLPTSSKHRIASG